MSKILLSKCFGIQNGIKIIKSIPSRIGNKRIKYIGFLNDVAEDETRTSSQDNSLESVIFQAFLQEIQILRKQNQFVLMLGPENTHHWEKYKCAAHLQCSLPGPFSQQSYFSTLKLLITLKWLVIVVSAEKTIWKIFLQKAL